MKHKKLAAWLCILLILITTGCGTQNPTETTGNADATGETGTPSQTGNGDANQGASDEPVAMGRYVEKVTDLSDRLNGMVGNGLYKLADGTIILTDGSSTPLLISKDNGETWEEDTSHTWHMKMVEEQTYISDLVIGADNTAAVIYNVEEGGWEPAGKIVKPDGTEISITPPPTVSGSFPYSAVVSDDGRVFVCGLSDSGLYEVKEDGTCELIVTIQGSAPQLMQFQGNLLIMDGYDYKAPLLYDIEKREFIEDEVLADFIQENYPDGNVYGDAWYDMYFFPGEENVLYLAGKKGLHRHVIGGSAIEQVIDGNLCTFNNPSYRIGSVIMLENNEFLAIFSGSRLVHFVYDPDMPTVPDERLKVYSLKDNDTIRQAVSLYQIANPEVFVEYEAAIGEGSSMTRDDALKALNTRIMAGEGPDVLILDEMPLDSYEEKGMLLDLSGLLSSLDGEDALFGNVVDAMKSGDSVYAMPCEIQVPFVAGKEQYISGMKDLKGIADAIVKMRQDNPGQDLLQLGTEKGIMRFYAMVCAPAWMTDGGEIDKAAITEFLEQTKRIYDAEMEGLPEQMKELLLMVNDNWMESFGELFDDSQYLRTRARAMGYVYGETSILSGALDSRNSYMEMHSVKRVEGFEDMVWSIMHGQSDNVFCTQTLLGISAASQSVDLAQDFIRLCLGKENQSSLFNGLPVNQAAFDEIFVPDTKLVDGEGAYSWASSSGPDGIMKSFVAYWVDEEQAAELKDCIKTLDTAYIEDTVLENAVYEEGINYFQGKQSLDEAVNAIEKKIALYLAE
ncbi:MAG: extracellular solute-binding protein [Muribaculaceae bacterium]|nr:extracellular solute-binding protein [Muribaculaceae bacterium]